MGTIKRNEDGTNGLHMTFDNGATLSIQWHSGNYCSNRNLRWNDNGTFGSPDVEIAIWASDGRGNEPFITLEVLSHDDDVMGWVTIDKLADIITHVQRLSADVVTKAAVVAWKRHESVFRAVDELGLED